MSLLSSKTEREQKPSAKWIRKEASLNNVIILTGDHLPGQTKAMIAIPWGFPTASSILPNKVEFQWIRWSWRSNNREAASALKVLLLRKTDISPSPWPYPYCMVCSKSITDRPREMTGLNPSSLCVNSLLISQQKQAQCLSSSASFPDQEHIRGTCRFQIDFCCLPLRQHPLWLSMKWNSKSGHKLENSLKGLVPTHSSTCHPPSPSRMTQSQSHIL